MPLVARKPTTLLIDLVGALNGRWSGYTALCRCPAHADRTPSLSLRQGDSGILVTCFAGCDRTDVLRELARISLGRHYPPPIDAKPARRASIDRLWREAVSAAEGVASRYLARRGLSQVPFDLRFHPRCPHGPMPHTQFKPALLVAVREGRQLTAIQRIFLDPVTATYTEKRMLGVPGRGAWRGRVAGDTLAIGEGFETAEAFALVNGIPCWASLGARRLDRLDIPTTVTTLIIAEDNDAEGRRAAIRAQQRYARPDRTISRKPPSTPFKDWAEVLDDRVKRGGESGG